ncbi:hypothetical protein [Flavobacterium coralii]|uniref:hypothetical protein n=1 Tax=Flavobacterium coralii TaxID=2838017 RepID=UPI000C46F20B|nr:hypothetical protein [Flavobacterium sp.]|tara:strand:+ start:16806 stop:17294 length:489 start_codon:yes stop_codon:yes gene_type:complete
MKKLLALIAVTFLFCACDFMLKDREDDNAVVPADKKVMLGTDKDANGCVLSAGYRWSVIRNECIRVFEEGYRLNSIEELKSEGISKSAFIIFEENGNRAELFLPEENVGILLKREKEGTPYKNNVWTLQTQNGYSLLKGGVLQYAGAAIEEQQITGDDKEES